jgi:hypothetical protein
LIDRAWRIRAQCDDAASSHLLDPLEGWRLAPLLFGEQISEGGMATRDEPVDRLACSALGGRVLGAKPFGEDGPDAVAGDGDEPGVGRGNDEQRQACNGLIWPGVAVGGELAECGAWGGP